MKKFILFSLLMLAVSVPAGAVPTTYSHTVNVVTMLDNMWWDGEAPILTRWDHTPLDNPYPGGSPVYDEALEDGLIEGVNLNLVIDDLDLGNSASVMFKDKDGIWHGLGYLNTMDYSDGLEGLVQGLGNPDPTRLTSTDFALDPHWLDGVSVSVQVSWEDFGGLSMIEVETATFSITAASATHAPAPGAVFLGCLGMGIVRLATQTKSTISEK